MRPNPSLNRPGKARKLGVCSWSLEPESANDLVAKVLAVGVDCIQLALASVRSGALDPAQLVASLDVAGVEIRSGMMSTRAEDYSTLDSIRRTGGIRPDEHWNANREIAEQDAALARALGLELVSFHAGFLPHDRRDPERTRIVQRLQTIVDVFADRGVRVAFETGQETAETLLDFLIELERPTAGVNFDPANMILYGMGDPVAALELLAPHVRQVHVKDARSSKSRGAWGSEVVVGDGEVDWSRFFAVLDARCPGVDLMIEREAGSQRVADIRRARDFVREISGKASE